MKNNKNRIPFSGLATKPMVGLMTEQKKIIAALLVMVFTVLVGFIVTDCNIAEMTSTRALIFIIADKFKFLYL